LEDLVLASKEQECEPSHFVKLIHSPDTSSQSIGQLSLAMMTSEPSLTSVSPPTPQLATSKLMSSAEAFHAKTYRSREEDWGWTASAADYGLNTPDLLARFDPKSSSWKTHQACFLSEWESFSQTWPRSGMMQNGIAYQLAPLVRIISGIASGSLLGPVRHMLPTLTVKGNYNVKGMSKTSGDGLATVLRRTLPTLVAHDYRGGAKPESAERKQLDTARGLDLPSSLRMIFPESTGIINPCWAEGYMGFPMGTIYMTPLAHCNTS
jgi:hypothetical protein